MSTKHVPFGDWLRAELDKAGMEISDFARKIGVQPATVSRWVNNNRQPASKYCYRIAEGLQIDPDVVLYFAGHRRELDRPLMEYERARTLDRVERQLHEVRREDLGPYIKVRTYGRVPAGQLKWRAVVEGNHFMDVPRGYVTGRALSDLFVIQADGDCLLKYAIKDKDLVLCRKIHTGPPKHDDIVVARVGDEFTLKRYCREGDWIHLRDGDGNSVYSVSIMNAEELNIVGIKLSRWEPYPGQESAP